MSVGNGGFGFERFAASDLNLGKFFVDVFDREDQNRAVVAWFGVRVERAGHVSRIEKFIRIAHGHELPRECLGVKLLGLCEVTGGDFDVADIAELVIHDCS